MFLRIHSGSCVEIRTRKTRILIDIGAKSVSNGNLPAIAGIFKADRTLVDGILISHPQQDFSGLVNALHGELKYYMGEDCFRKLSSVSQSAGMANLFKNHTLLERYTPFVIGELKISPFRMEHATFHAYAFLVEGERGSILYSGHFPGKNKDSEAYRRFLSHAPKRVDYLLLEDDYPDHADSTTLKEYVSAIQPKNIVPMQPSKGVEYRKQFSYPVRELKDGEELSC